MYDRFLQLLNCFERQKDLAHYGISESSVQKKKNKDIEVRLVDIATMERALQDKDDHLVKLIARGLCENNRLGSISSLTMYSDLNVDFNESMLSEYVEENYIYFMDEARSIVNKSIYLNEEVEVSDE